MLRGDHRSPGEEVSPGVPEVLAWLPARFEAAAPESKTTGRRTALARWIAAADNPLTARVIVNRVWQYHFGTGLVATASNFGESGAEPTHPELLDWLASELVAGGWRLKPLHKLILQSAAYIAGDVARPGRLSGRSGQSLAVAVSQAALGSRGDSRSHSAGQRQLESAHVRTRHSSADRSGHHCHRLDRQVAAGRKRKARALAAQRLHLYQAFGADADAGSIRRAHRDRDLRPATDHDRGHAVAANAQRPVHQPTSRRDGPPRAGRSGTKTIWRRRSTGSTAWRCRARRPKVSCAGASSFSTASRTCTVAQIAEPAAAIDANQRDAADSGPRFGRFVPRDVQCQRVHLR